MKKKLMVLSLVAMLAVPSCVYADNSDFSSMDPEVLNAIDSSDLSEDELREAYDAIRKSYTILHEEYVKTFTELKMSQASGSGSEESEDAEDPAEAKVWEQRFYVDEFDQPTDNPYITNMKYFEGTFSNSVTNNSPLYAAILVDAEGIGIKLYEYKNSPVTGYRSKGQSFSINILPPDGGKLTVHGMLYNNSKSVYVVDSAVSNYRTDLLNVLKGGGEIKISMQSDGDSYLFTIPSSYDFKDLYESTFE